jgi:SAM-dependent methyltransferase
VTSSGAALRLLDVVRRREPPEPWSEGDNIPWHDPGFSPRMLRAHLSQEHDAASRRAEKIDRHVAAVHARLLGGRPSRVLDLGCGPGLYTSRLAALGHACTGVDYSPASIAHARRQSAEAASRCTYIEADVRTADLGGGYGLVTMLYGELNVFAPEDARAILARARAALREGGVLLLEPHTFEAVRGMGEEPATWYSSESGLFADAPHLCLIEHHWDEERRATTTRYYVVDAASGAVVRHAQTMQAYARAEYDALLREAGFRDVVFEPSLTGSEADAEEGLLALVARP